MQERKTNIKAPSKIYAAIMDNRLDASFLEKSIGKEKYPEFVRKDALLEWAKGEMMPGNSAEGKGWNLALQTLIDKLNSM